MKKALLPRWADGLECLFRLFCPAGRPLLAQLWVETRCNLSCTGCQTHEPVDSCPAQTVDEMKAIIISLRKMRVKLLNLTGGEPFLNPYISELVSTARSSEYPYSGIPLVSVISNGTMLLKMASRKRERVLNRLSNSGLTHLTLSVDRLHWPALGQRQAHLSALVGLCQMVANHQIIPTINWVLCSTDTCEEVIAAATQVIQSGSHFNLLLYSSVGGEFSVRKDVLIPSRNQVVTLAEELLHVKKTHYVPPFGTVANMVRELRWMVDQYSAGRMWNCNGSNHPVITIKPCRGSRSLKVGFCQEYSYRETCVEITADKYREIRRSSWGQELRANCRGCFCSSYIRLDQRVDKRYVIVDLVHCFVVGAYLRSQRLGELTRRLLIPKSFR